MERAEEAGERMDMSLRDTVLPVASLPAPPYSREEGEIGGPSAHPSTNILFTLGQNLFGVRVAHFPSEACREVTDHASFFSTAQSHLGR